MKNKLLTKLKALCYDYEIVTGSRFEHFFCPILFIDEDSELCEAHIINKAFPITARSWTIQRKDIDGFFGRLFEADFLKIAYKIDNLSPEEIICNKELDKKYKPKIYINNNLADHYYSSGIVPNCFSRIQINEQKNGHFLVIKTDPKNMSEHVEIGVDIDLRVSSTVSLIKAAYLTLFEMLGYRYSLSIAGKIIGSGALGLFYQKYKKEKSKEKVIFNAKIHFEKYVNLVRPVDSNAFKFDGTCKDKKLLLCVKSSVVWGCIVFIKISSTLHAVLMPLFESQAGEDYFEYFLKSCGYFSTQFGIFKDDSWALSPNTYEMYWPNSNASLLS